MVLFYRMPNHPTCTTPIPSAVQTDNAAYQKVKVVTGIFFSFTNKCYILGITSQKQLLSLKFTVTLQ